MGDTPDFKIAYDGTWFHNGEVIGRHALAKLFSDRALKCDADGNYWLQTPYEKYPVAVEDVPYVIRQYDYDDGFLRLITNMDETICVDADKPLFLRDDPVQGIRLPYIEVRAGLLARLGRNVYYQMIEEFGAKVKSGGVLYPLGDLIDEGAKEEGGV